MNQQVTEKIDELIVTLCDYIEEHTIEAKKLISGSHQLPILIDSLANLVKAQSTLCLSQTEEPIEIKTVLAEDVRGLSDLIKSKSSYLAGELIRKEVDKCEGM